MRVNRLLRWLKVSIAVIGLLSMIACVRSIWTHDAMIVRTRECAFILETSQGRISSWRQRFLRATDFQKNWSVEWRSRPVFWWRGDLAPSGPPTGILEFGSFVLFNVDQGYQVITGITVPCWFLLIILCCFYWTIARLLKTRQGVGFPVECKAIEVHREKAA
jgi:hypothetical protein